MLHHPDRERFDVPSLSLCVSGGSALPVEVLRGFDEAFGCKVLQAYWNYPDATAEVMRDGWFHTGDIAVVDEEGYFSIVDRKKDLIIRGGYNVYPREIEEVFYEHPAIREAAVVGMPHDDLGEEASAR
jgi:long-chain acyl-CoA synthetase